MNENAIVASIYGEKAGDNIYGEKAGDKYPCLQHALGLQ